MSLHKRISCGNAHAYWFGLDVLLSPENTMQLPKWWLPDMFFCCESAWCKCSCKRNGNTNNNIILEHMPKVSLWNVCNTMNWPGSNNFITIFAFGTRGEIKYCGYFMKIHIFLMVFLTGKQMRQWFTLDKNNAFNWQKCERMNHSVENWANFQIFPGS